MPPTANQLPPEVVAQLPPDLQEQVPLYDETLQPNLYISDAICLFVAIMAVILRIYARRLKQQILGWDDYLIIIALFFNTVFISLCIFLVTYGMGRHTIVTVVESPHHTVPFAKATLSAGILYNLPLFCTKVSILILYTRLFPSTRFKRVCIGVGIFVGAYSITAIMTNIFQCTPVQSNWDKTITPHCVDLGLELTIVSSINVLTDATILVLPMPFIWRLKTNLRRKIQLSALFLLGTFVVVVSIIRATYVSDVSFSDGFWVNSFPSMWSVVEDSLAIVAACLPVMRPIFNKLAYGAPAGRSNLSNSEGKKSSSNRHIITIGGSEIPLKRFSNALQERRIGMTDPETISADHGSGSGKFHRLEDS